MNQPFSGISSSVRKLLVAGLAISSLLFLICFLFVHASVAPALNTALCAGWAVHADRNIYHVADDQGDVFHGAPLVAILLSPLGQPPGSAHQEAIIPRPVTLFLLSVLLSAALFLSVHHLACYLERHHFSEPCSTFTWWYHRLIPLLLCAGPISTSLLHFLGDAIVLFLLTGWLLAVAQRRSLVTGCWLAGAITVKLFPAFLLIVAVFRRDRLMTLATLAGLVLSLILLPSLFFGFQRTSRLNEQYLTSMPQQFQDIKTTDSNASLCAVLHRLQGSESNVQFLSSSHLATIVLLTTITLMAVRTFRPTSMQMLLTGSSLLIILTLASPIFELHHALLLIPAMTIQLIKASYGRFLGLMLVGIGLLLPALLDHPVTSILYFGSAVLLWGIQVVQVSTMSRQIISLRLPAEATPLAQAA